MSFSDAPGGAEGHQLARMTGGVRGLGGFAPTAVAAAAHAGVILLAAVLGAPGLLGELALEHLAGRVSRQLFDKHDLSRHLVAREVVLDVAP